MQVVDKVESQRDRKIRNQRRRKFLEGRINNIKLHRKVRIRTENAF